MLRKKIIIAVIIVIAVASTAIFVYQRPTDTNAKSEITVGAIGSDSQTWQYIAKLSETKEKNIKIVVKNFTDGVSLNTATAEGQIDVNAFQSYAYYNAYNKSNKNNQLAALGTTYLEPMGIYSNKYKDIRDIPNGATIAIANNAANTSRGLRLLEKSGLITLQSDFGSLSGVNAIKNNPHHLKFKEIDDTTGPHVFKDPDIAAALIGNTIALEGKLNVLKDTIFYERINQSTKDNINILATTAKEKNNKKFKQLVQLYHSQAAQKYISRKFDNTKIEVNKPISYLSN